MRARRAFATSRIFRRRRRQQQRRSPIALTHSQTQQQRQRWRRWQRERALSRKAFASRQSVARAFFCSALSASVFIRGASVCVCRSLFWHRLNYRYSEPRSAYGAIQGGDGGGALAFAPRWTPKQAERRAAAMTQLCIARVAAPLAQCRVFVFSAACSFLVQRKKTRAHFRANFQQQFISLRSRAAVDWSRLWRRRRRPARPHVVGGRQRLDWRPERAKTAATFAKRFALPAAAAAPAATRHIKCLLHRRSASRSDGRLVAVAAIAAVVAAAAPSPLTVAVCRVSHTQRAKRAAKRASGKMAECNIFVEASVCSIKSLVYRAFANANSRF